MELRHKELEERRHALRAAQEDAGKMRKQLTRAESKSQQVAAVSDAPSELAKHNENLLVSISRRFDL